jgi:hypothetical protein
MGAKALGPGCGSDLILRAPHNVPVGRRVRLVFTATIAAQPSPAKRAGRPVPGVVITFNGRRTTTGRRGTATLTTTLRRRGSFRALATRSGLQTSVAIKVA